MPPLSSSLSQLPDSVSALKMEDILNHLTHFSYVADLGHIPNGFGRVTRSTQGSGCRFKKPSSIPIFWVLQYVIRHNKWAPVCSVFPRNPSDAGFST